MPKYKSPINLPDEHMRLVGIIAAHWEFIEAILERSIAEVMEHEWQRVRLLTVNIGFRSKCDLILLHARPLTTTDKPAWREFTKTLETVKNVYKLRNKFVHGQWHTDDDGDDPTLLCVRTAGGKLTAERAQVPITELEDAARQIYDASEQLIRLFQRYGVLLPSNDRPD